MPCPTLPYRVCRTQPCATLPLPYRTVSYPMLSYPTLPHLTLPYHTLPTLPCVTLPYPTLLNPTLPYLPSIARASRRGRFYLEMQGLPGMPLEEVAAKLSKVTQAFLDDGLQLDRWGIHRVALA